MDVRFATFNASLNRNVEGQLVADLSTPPRAYAYRSTHRSTLEALDYPRCDMRCDMVELTH